MSEKTFIAALVDALAFSLDEDPRVEVIGAGSFVLERGLPAAAEAAFEAKYAARMTEPPTSESLIAALAVGAACTGSVRPFVNFGTSSFMFEAWDQIVNEAAVA